MRIIIFKKKYEFKLPDGKILSIDPVERIRKGLKTTTTRIKDKFLVDHQVKQGGWYKNFMIHRDFYLKIYKKELKRIRDFTPEEIRIDLGLIIEEFELVLNNKDPNDFFLEGMRKINSRYHIERGSVVWLHYFDYIPILKKQERKMRSLESYMKGSGK